jgi:DNA-directed RNA polymerase specialized sigma24 family protein
MRSDPPGAVKSEDFFRRSRQAIVGKGLVNRMKGHGKSARRQAFEAAFIAGMNDVMAQAEHFYGAHWMEAEDAIHDAFAGAWQKWQTEPIENMAAYLKRCVRNYFARRSRARKTYDKFCRETFGETLWRMEEEDPQDETEIERKLEFVATLKGRLDDSLVRVVETLVKCGGDLERAAGELGFRRRSLEEALTRIRSWKRGEDDKYDHWRLMFAPILMQCCFSQCAAAHQLGRTTITKHEFQAFLRGHFSWFEQAVKTAPTTLDLMNLVNLKVPLATVAHHQSHHLRRQETNELLKKVGFLITHPADVPWESPELHDCHPVGNAASILWGFLQDGQPGLSRALQPFIDPLLELALELPHPKDVVVVE